ncbi:MAG: AIR synthase-related protein [Butyrivibrio sp.]|nr:AIR synthase-related protein [Butyrivibrio sp.]
MREGKVSGNILKRSVINLTGRRTGIGVDCAAVPASGAYALSATAVGVSGNAALGGLAVYKAANNIWAAGGELYGFEAAFLLGTDTDERELKALTRSVAAACESCGSFLAGGHTEVSKSINGACVTVTAIGGADRVMSVKGVKPGDEIVATKWQGLEETAVILADGELRARLFTRYSPQYFEQMEECAEWLTVRDEARFAVRFGAFAMHDVSDGGIYGALWDFAEGAGYGLEIASDSIPFRQETVEIAEFFGIDAYRMKSSGSLLIAGKDGAKLAARLSEAGIPSRVIGRFTDNNDKIIRNGDEISYLGRN